jgi:hypothetical protein
LPTMPSDVTTALIAGGSAVAGGLIVALSNYVVSRAQAKDAKRDRMRSAFEGFLSVTLRLDVELRRLPNAGRVVTETNRIMAKAMPVIDDKFARIAERLFEPHLESLKRDLTDAMAATLLIAPPEARPALDRLAKAMGSEPRDPKWWTEWEEARDEVVVAFLKALGESLGTGKATTHVAVGVNAGTLEAHTPAGKAKSG